MLAADALSSWQNPNLPTDVNADGYVTAIDALRLINELNIGGPRQLTGSPAPAITRFSFMAAGEQQPAFLDVTGDGVLNSSDALAVINKLNAAQGEQIRIRIEVTDLNGNPVENLLPGQEFQLRGYVKDLREPQNDPSRGVFSAYVDVTFNASQVMADLDGRSITYGDPLDAVNLFPGGHRNAGSITATAGKLEDIGAFSNTQPYGSQEEIIFVAPMQVAGDAARGPVSFGVEDDMTILFDTTVFGSNAAVPADEIIFVGDQVMIGFPPTAVADTASVLEDVSTVIDVLANDTVAPEGMEPLTVVAVTQGAHGTVSIALDGQTVQYTPAANFVGQDTFTYTVADDDGNPATGTVTVTVTAVNDPPTANPDTFTVDADETTVLDVLLNDSIAPDDTGMLRVTAVSTPSGGGTVSIPTDGQRIHYTPAAGFTGAETFSYVVSDGSGLVSMAIVTVNVRNNNPIAQTDFATFVEDSQENVTNVLANDQLAPGVQGVLLIVGADPGSHGGVVSIGPNDDTLIYSPAANFAGTELISYRIVDGQGGEATGMVVVTVTNLNDPPTANDDALTVNEDTSANTLNVLANDMTAPDTGEMLTITAVSATSNGGVIMIATSGRSLVYTPAPAFFGQEAFTYTVSDGHGGADTATVTVTVSDVTETPTANDDTATVTEDSSDNMIDVLANDTDPDAGDTLMVSAVAQGSRGGDIEIAADGLSLKYTPAANISGEETFTYTVSDGKGGTDTATVAVRITAVNDPPTAAPDTFPVAEGSTDNKLDVLANDSFAPDEGESLEITELGAPSAGGTIEIAADKLRLIYTPADDFVGNETFTYTIDDGTGITATAMVTVQVGDVNDPPTASDDEFDIDEDDEPTPLTVLANDSAAPDTGETLTITAVGETSADGTVTIAENKLSLIYTPAANFSGVDTFTYTISDGNGGTDTATVTVNIAAVNDVPPTAPDAKTVAEDSATTSIDVLANDLALPNPDGAETFTITAVLGATNGGTIAIAPDGLSVTYTPAANFSGIETFTYTVSDGNQGSAIGAVTVTVTPVDDLPTPVDDAREVDRDTSNNPLNVLANDTDPDAGDTRTITAVGQGSNGGTVTIATGGGGLLYTPAAGFVGTDIFTYTVSDSDGGTATATVTVTVRDFQTGSLSGFVYVDSNGNGGKDAAEQPLPNVSIHLWGTDFLKRPVNLITTTDANGAYRFVGLVAGSYVIEQTQPAQFVDGLESLGTTGGTAGRDQFFLALDAGENGANYNFAERGLRSAIGRPSFFRP